MSNEVLKTSRVTRGIAAGDTGTVERVVGLEAGIGGAAAGVLAVVELVIVVGLVPARRDTDAEDDPHDDHRGDGGHRDVVHEL